MFRYADVASILKPERDPKFEVSDRKKALGWLTVINSLAQALNNAVCIKRSVDIGGAHKLIALKVNNGATQKSKERTIGIEGNLKLPGRN